MNYLIIVVFLCVLGVSGAFQAIFEFRPLEVPRTALNAYEHNANILWSNLQLAVKVLNFMYSSCLVVAPLSFSTFGKESSLRKQPPHVGRLSKAARCEAAVFAG